MQNIPNHTNCKNCGECCGPVMCTQQEAKAILDYIEKNNIKINKTDFFNCCCHDKANKKCLIYPVRPTICKLMGVTKGMDCPEGNTYEIDGNKFISNEQVAFLNLLLNQK